MRLWLLFAVALMGCTDSRFDGFEDGSSTGDDVGGAGGAGASGSSQDSTSSGETSGSTGTGTFCSPGATQCDGDDVRTCAPDGSGFEVTETCEFVCSGGACAGSCEPGQNQCSGDTLEACGANGAWQVSNQCPFVCNGSQCEGECVPGTAQCNGSTPQSCDQGGFWVDGADCPSVCSNGACTGSCVPGSKQCSGLTPQTCGANGQWTDEAACSFVCAAGSCSGACTPGQTKCSGLTPQTCNAQGQWVNGSSCPFVCSSGTCGGQCVPGEAQCSGLTPQVCNAQGQWVSNQACPFVCSMGSCGGQCVPGTKQCVGAGVQQCGANGQWLTPTQCAAPANAVGACVGAGTCTWDCDASHEDCNGAPSDGCEKSLTDPNSCGSCSNQCSWFGGTATCGGSGSCGIVCDGAHANCNGSVSDGCEVGLGSVTNCMGCGDTCSAPAHANPTCTGSGCGFVCAPLFGNCDGNATNGCEKDVGSDPFNCGGCGISCFGGTCSNGTCSTGITKVAEAASVTSLAVATKYAVNEVFWTSTSGEVARAPANGGQVSVIASGENGPDAVVTDGANIIWSDTTVPKRIRSVPILGGSVVNLVTGHGPVELTHDGQNLYWTNRTSYSACFCGDGSNTPIYQMGLTGGVPNIISSNSVSTWPGWPGVLVDADNAYRMYWDPSGVGCIKLQPKNDPTSGGDWACNTNYNNNLNEFSNARFLTMTPNGTIVFFADLTIDGPAIVKAKPVNLSSVVTPISSLTVTGLTASDTHAYVIGHVNTQPDQILRYPLAGGPPTTLAANQHNATNIQVDGSHVYWAVDGVRFGTNPPTLNPAIVRVAK